MAIMPVSEDLGSTGGFEYVTPLPGSRQYHELPGVAGVGSIAVEMAGCDRSFASPDHLGRKLPLKSDSA